MLRCRDGIAAPLKCYNGQWAFRGYTGMGAVEVCAVLNNYDAAPARLRETAPYMGG
jgi:alkyl sulfatase BDS1-like metallo-beta-lactamase superfamily hydrolase